MIPKKYILLIEDKEDDIEFFKDALAESGLDFMCSTARSIVQAFKILNNTAPDIIFIGIRMAARDNGTCIKQIRAQRSTRPVVIYTNTGNCEIESRGIKVLDYVKLPSSVAAMGRILHNLFVGDQVISATPV